jgi:hypothetical protein
MIARPLSLELLVPDRFLLPFLHYTSLSFVTLFENLTRVAMSEIIDWSKNTEGMRKELFPRDIRKNSTRKQERILD